MIDFLETKSFNAAVVGALTMMVSRYSGTSTWAAIVLALLVVAAFLLTFDKTARSGSRAHLRSRRLNDPTWLALVFPISESELTKQIAQPQKWRAPNHR